MSARIAELLLEINTKFQDLTMDLADIRGTYCFYITGRIGREPTEVFYLFYLLKLFSEQYLQNSWALQFITHSQGKIAFSLNPWGNGNNSEANTVKLLEFLLENFEKAKEQTHIDLVGL